MITGYDSLLTLERDKSGKVVNKKRPKEEEELLKELRRIQKLIKYHENSDSIDQGRKKANREC